MSGLGEQTKARLEGFAALGSGRDDGGVALLGRYDRDDDGAPRKSRKSRKSLNPLKTLRRRGP
jgi:hypothetical protein